MRHKKSLGASPSRNDRGIMMNGMGLKDAINLARILGERFSVGSEGVRFASRSAYRNSWVDWRDSLRELGVELRHIGRRGHASLKNGKQGRRDTGTGIQTRYLGPAGG